MSFQAHRLVFARKRRQLTQAALGRAIGVVARTIQRYENAEETPPEEQLGRLARELLFPVDFFLDERPLPDIPAPSLSFRAYSKLKARLRDNAVAVAQMSVGIEAFLSEHFELPDFAVPDLRECASTPTDGAKILRAEWGLGGGPIANMVHLLEARGVRVFSLAEEVADVDAFCFWHDSTAFVVLNQMKSAERGRFDAAHELGHLALHRHIDFGGKDVERDADAFASEFLVPEESLHPQLPSVITLETVFKLKRHWRISAMAMVRRLKDVGRLSDWVYRSMCMQLSRDGYRSHEKDGIEGETSSLLTDMLRAEDGLAAADIARALRVRLADVSPLIFGLPQARGHLRLVQARSARAN